MSLETECKKCGALIVWCLTASGKFIPVEYDTFNELRMEWDVSPDGQDIPAYSKRNGHMAHFEFCRGTRGQKSEAPKPPMESPAHKCLFVRPDAPMEVIKAAHKALALMYHPDKGGDTRKMQEVNAAFDKLKRGGFAR